MSSSIPLSIQSYSTVEELSVALADLFVTLSVDAIQTRGRFTVGLSGGSLPKILAADLVKRVDAVEWEKLTVFFCDERLVPLDHEDSNYRLCREELFSKVPIPEEQIHKINPDLLENAEEVAEDYKDQLIHVFAHVNSAKFPVFDLLLLGIGPDGHTCSLFPGHQTLEDTIDWVIPEENSPKPPPRRITFTLPTLNHAHNVCFVATGEGKQDILKRIIDENDQKIPSALVQPVHGNLFWFLDDKASAKLTLREKK
ncbi:13350_t:CDS:2 [Ambispora leptoticha]|uniref:6-phosphogluconolactonase n=1 Tax=Ambispora leptoticha TaxID=144679 RepID=A0A9N9ACX8_9GLOM|nr:13350_t:CDS:2 [Ambispora leptoticha]